MTINPARVAEQPSERGRPTMVEMIERLSRFDGPPEQFLVNLLAVQCHLAAADGGAILRVNPSGGVEILAVYPQPAPGSTAPVWLAQSAESAPAVVRGGRPAIRPLHSADDLYGQPAGKHVILLPLRGGSGVLGMATFVVSGSDQKALAATQQRLELTVSLLSLYEMRLTLQQRQGDLMRLRVAMETTASVGEHDRFNGAAMAFCNEVASRWSADRVALGFLKGRYVHLKAMSHTEKFSRKMKIVQDVEAAMEETLDQDVEVLYPAPQEATFVNRAAGELSKRHGPTAVLSMPLRRGEEPVAVLTLERASDEPFALEEIESLRLTTDLSTPWLTNLHKHDRWFGARAAGAVRSGFAALLGPKHTWVKLAGLAVCAALLFLIFVKGSFRADASFVLQATKQQVVPTPFDGFLRHAYVLPGDVVVGPTGPTPSWELADADVRDWPGLLAELVARGKADATSPGKRIWSRLSDASRQAIEAQGAGDPGRGVGLALAGVDEPTRTRLLADLNDLLRSAGLYDRGAFGGLEPTARQKDLLSDQAAGMLRGVRLVELNRSLLAGAMPGKVAPGPTVLGTLETAELRLELKAAEAELMGYRKQADAAMKEDKRAEAQIAQANADKVQARMRLLEYRIEQAVLVSPIDGYVVSGDLQRQLGAPVKTGDVLFEIAALKELRAELSVPEDMMADVQTALRAAELEGRQLGGELATAARPEGRCRFTVTRINPVAEAVEQTNVFKVRARLEDPEDWLRPGMEGVAKIDIDQRSYGYIWTRGLVNWVRMKFWL
ncbi:MAG TPA: HlyD family efflux transporter periplasmic adaptor subunit [Phycisphaerae bacterium]|nr:HlyD family efflux transporter periplasmic adaptor subunit [Phycisphaerae bacterium]